MPSGAVLKYKIKQKERSIRCSYLAKSIIPLFLNLDKKLPSRVSWRENLRRWAVNVGIEPDGLCAKTTRKTWESWLMFYYPERRFEVVLSQGHTSATSVTHYLNMPFTNEDKLVMEEFVAGW